MSQSDFFLKVVANQEEYLKSVTVRSLVYIGEQSCAWNEEFDGNDHCATQILGLLGDEPVATARIRWFAEFAKLERLAVRSEYRGKGFGKKLLQYLLKLSQKKGFSTCYLHAQTRLEKFYNMHGFIKIKEPFGFSDHTYIEMVADLSLSHTSTSHLNLHKNPHILNRPEGVWDKPGVLEFSIERTIKKNPTDLKHNPLDQLFAKPNLSVLLGKP